jgi:hypothetical protein
MLSLVEVNQAILAWSLHLRKVIQLAMKDLHVLQFAKSF